MTIWRAAVWCALLGPLGMGGAAHADDAPALRKAFVDGTGPDWRSLGEADFVNVNCESSTWTWKDGLAHCTGQPVGVIRSQKQYTNFELVAEWQHLKSAGNSGIFVWTAEEALKDLKPGVLPKRGIEVQILDHGFTAKFEKQTGKKADWFTTNGDVFPVGSATMKPFPPAAPDGQRSFPRKNLSKGVDEWNHYYVRAINGEIRLWVNGEKRQEATSRDLIVDIPQMIVIASSASTLYPGDLIATGTPAGVGMPRGEFLKAGDEVKIEIAGCGTLVNRMINDGPHRSDR